MKKFLITKSFTGFEILIAFLVPTIVYYIFAVDWTYRFSRNKDIINCRTFADASIAEAIKRVDSGVLTRKRQKNQFEIDMNFCLINLPKILKKQNDTLEKYFERQGLKYVK